MNVRACQKLAGLLMALLLVGLQTPAYAEQAKVKATWVWQTEWIKDGGEELLDYSHEEGINLIYLQINRQMSAEIYQTFVEKAHAANIAVHALGAIRGGRLRSICRICWALPIG